MNIKIKLLLFSLIAIVVSCRKDSALKKDIQDPVVPQPVENIKYGSVKINISNMIGNELLVLNDSSYTNTNGDNFMVSKFKYYLSNFALRNVKGELIKERESYYLVDCNQGSNFNIVIDSVPVGTYNAMNFVLGVDSARNTSGAQVGALDPALGMFWSWNQGYIFLMMEGNSPNSTLFGNSLIFHLGGFTKPYNCIRSVSPSFGALDLVVSEDKTSQIEVSTDMLKMFDTPNLIKFAQTSEAMGGAVAVTLANNAVNMFKVTAIQN